MEQSNSPTGSSNALQAPDPRRLLGGWSTGVAAGIIMGKLTEGPLKSRTDTFDRLVSRVLRKSGDAVLSSAMSTFSRLGEPATIYPFGSLLAALWLLQGKPQASLTVGLAMAGSPAIDKIVKAVVHKPRPHRRMPFSNQPAGSTFPSNHAMMSLATYGAIGYLIARKARRKAGAGGNLSNTGRSATRRRAAIRLGVLLLCALIGWSRVYEGVHNPSDVLGGWIVGGIWLAACTSKVQAA